MTQCKNILLLLCLPFPFYNQYIHIGTQPIKLTIIGFIRTWKIMLKKQA